MNYWNYRDNDNYIERYELVMDRLTEINDESADGKDGYSIYFHEMAQFFILIRDYIRKDCESGWENETLENLKKENERLFTALLPNGYEKSVANPAYAITLFEKDLASVLTVAAAEMYGCIAYAARHRYEIVTIFAELCVELYTISQNRFDPDMGRNDLEVQSKITQMIKDSLYWFLSDYSDVLIPDRIEDLLNPDASLATELLKKMDLRDLRYLYLFGEYIGDQELSMATYLNSLPEETIEKCVDNFVDGYIRGYENYQIDFSHVKTVDLRFDLGMERLVLGAIRRFEAMGISPVIYQKAVSCLNKRQNIHVGYGAVGPNPQYEYDHRFDDAIILDKKFKERKLEILRSTYQSFESLCKVHGGPILIEGFGGDSPKLTRTEGACAYTSAQSKILNNLRSEQLKLQNEFIDPESVSFCIVSYPVPQIGPDFEEIFAETIKVNTLDNDLYEKIQQQLINALDQGECVHVTGRNGNETDLYVSLWALEDPDHQTCFENCRADVNIPVGEVFTSPRLSKTTGLLHVKQVFLNGLEYKDLKIYLEDGFVKDYSCENFATEEENRLYIKENILFNHETLPIGEFAIGTNTTAYCMARRYGISDKLDILIAEKTGPHFALGDTCYSHCEDMKVYNPDGKEIIARDNENVRQYKEQPEKAYFSCHTDITIPYDELGVIDVLKAGEDKEAIRLIENGYFVLPGTEELNKPLVELDSWLSKNAK